MTTDTRTYRITDLLRLDLLGVPVPLIERLIAMGREQTTVFALAAEQNALLVHRGAINVWLRAARHLGLDVDHGVMPILDAERAGKVDRWQDVDLGPGELIGEVTWRPAPGVCQRRALR